MQTTPSVAHLLDRVTAWAASQPTIAGLALVGSYARGEARADSDIDLVLLCTQPPAYVCDTAWIQCFGEVERCDVEDWGLVRSLRVHYRDGVEVEFGLTTLAWAQLPVDPGTRSVVAPGLSILFDRDGRLARLRDAVVAS